MLKFYTGMLGLMLMLSACRSQNSVSDSKTSREARSLIGGAADFDRDLLLAIDEPRLAADWSYQRSLSWRLWRDANQNITRERAAFAKWQTFYSKEDLQGIFRSIYAALTPEQRAARVALSDQQIADGLRYFNYEQFLSPDWQKEAFERWFAKYDSASKQLSLPGMNKVLMNETALLFFLKNYAAIDSCAKTGAASCPALVVPPHAAFLKTAWRRGHKDFLVPYYQTVDLGAQLAAEEWQIKSEGVPAPDSSYRIETPSGQVYHLTAVHLTLKLQSSWFWTSLWLDESSGEDTLRPEAMASVWKHYRLCSANGFKGLARPDSPDSFERAIAAAEGDIGASWCSNPYLEGGINNHKTNCIGCHQHAGSSWSQEDFHQHLQNDLASVTAAAPTRSSSDFVWSLYNGPEPFASFISQEVDYFDIYDRF